MSLLKDQLKDQLQHLKDSYDLWGIKGEFEAEGSSFRDMVRLRELTKDTQMIVKIGGCEAISDMRSCYTLGVDGIVAPMVESPFSCHKFIQGIKRVYGNDWVYRAINIETKQAVWNLGDILREHSKALEGITIGRSDLSASYDGPQVHPDCRKIFKIIDEVSLKVAEYGLDVTVGGSLTARSIYRFYENPYNPGAPWNDSWISQLDRLETRKVILPTANMLTKGGLDACLKFEMLWILWKQEIADRFIEEELARLQQLKLRSSHG